MFIAPEGADYLMDPVYLEGVAVGICERIGLHPIKDTFQARSFPSEHKDGPGVTVVGIMEESSITLHTWPERGNLINLNVFSCQAYDDKLVAAALEAAFERVANVGTWIKIPRY